MDQRAATALRPEGSGLDENGPDEFASGEYLTVQKFIKPCPTAKNTRSSRSARGPPYDNTPVYVVPNGYVFMMGDNRDDFPATAACHPHSAAWDMCRSATWWGACSWCWCLGRFHQRRCIWEWLVEFRLSRVLNGGALKG